MYKRHMPTYEPYVYFYFYQIYILPNTTIPKVAKTILVLMIYIVPNAVQKISSIGAVLGLL